MYLMPLNTVTLYPSPMAGSRKVRCTMDSGCLQVISTLWKIPAVRSWHPNPDIYYHWSKLTHKISIFTFMLRTEGLAQVQGGAMGGLPTVQESIYGLQAKSCVWETQSGIEGWPLFLVLIIMSWGHPSSRYQRSDLKSEPDPWVSKVYKRPRSCWTLPAMQTQESHVVPLDLNHNGHVDSHGMVLPSPSFKHIVFSFVPQTSTFLTQDIGMDVVVT